MAQGGTFRDKRRGAGIVNGIRRLGAGQGQKLCRDQSGSDRTREASWPLRSGDTEYCSWAAELPYDTGVCGDQGKRTRAACLPECLVHQSCLSLQSHGLQPARLLCAWGFTKQEYWSELPWPPPGDRPNPGSNPGLPHCRWILYHLSHQGSPLGHWKGTWPSCRCQGSGWVLKVRERTGSGSDRTLFEEGERVTEEEWKGETERDWGQRW